MVMDMCLLTYKYKYQYIEKHQYQKEKIHHMCYSIAINITHCRIMKNILIKKAVAFANRLLWNEGHFYLFGILSTLAKTKHRNSLIDLLFPSLQSLQLTLAST